MPAANEESCDATDPDLSRTINADTATAESRLRDAEARAEALDILARLIAQPGQQGQPGGGNR
jgi:hypothetical protein